MVLVLFVMMRQILDNEFLLGKHLLVIHKVCINTKIKVLYGNEDWYRKRWYSNDW